MRERGQQAGAHGRVVLRDGAELAVAAPQAPQVHAEVIEAVGLGHDPGQRVHEPVALGRHRDTEQLPRLRMAQEQVRVEEQGHRVTMHGHTGEGIPETLDVQAAPSRGGQWDDLLTGEPR